MPGSKCMGLHCVPVYQWEEGRRKERDGWLLACSDCVRGLAAMDSQHYEYQAWKHWKYRGCTYPQILNHVNYRVTPFAQYSCFMMKTETNCDFRSSVLFMFCFVSFLSTTPLAQLRWNSIRSLGSAAATATVLLRTSPGMFWLRGSNSHLHPLRWRDVALLIRGLHFYSQPWSHLEAYATVQLRLNVPFSLCDSYSIHGWYIWTHFVPEPLDF